MKLKVLLLSVLLSGGSAFAQVNNARMLSTPNAQTGASYTFVAADTTRVVSFNNANPVAVTLPNGATLGFGAGTILSAVNLGVGLVTITCTSCTINGNATITLAQNTGTDLYGGAGSPAVNYVAQPIPGGALPGGTLSPSNLNSIIFVDGVTYPLNSTGLTAACTAAGSSGTVGISKPIVMTANVTCSSAILFFAGGTITTTGWTLTLNGTLAAPSVQIFIGTGTIALLGGQPSHAVWFPGADIIAQAVNSYSAFPAAPSAGTILIDPNPSGGCWSATTAGVFNRPGVYPIIQGVTPASSTSLFAHGGNCINYTPTTATNAFTLDYVPSNGSSYVPAHGIRDLTIINNACTTNGGCGSSAVGIAMGATNGGAQRGFFSNLHIEGFGTGFLNGNGTSWGQAFLNNTWTHNTTGISLTTSPLEQMMFNQNDFVTNGTDFSSTGGADIVVQGGSWDGHTTLGYSATGTPSATFLGVHFENFNCATQNCVHYINSTGQVTIIGGVLLDDTAGAANRDYSIQVNNAVIRGLTISSATETFTNFALVNGFADMQFMVASSGLTPCPTFSTTSVCAAIGTGVTTPFVNTPILGLGTTSGAHNVLATPTAVRSKTWIADQGTVCTNGELALSAGWQSTGSATVTAVAGNGQTCSWTITTGTTTAANPTVTDTLTNALPAATTRCWMFLEYGPASTHTAASGEGFAQTTLSATAPVFTFNGTPTAAGKTYLVVRTCGP